MGLPVVVFILVHHTIVIAYRNLDGGDLETETATEIDVQAVVIRILVIVTTYTPINKARTEFRAGSAVILVEEIISFRLRIVLQDFDSFLQITVRSTRRLLRMSME